MISTTIDAMRAAEERPVHPDDEFEHGCGRLCNCDWYYWEEDDLSDQLRDEDRDDGNDGVDEDLGLDSEDEDEWHE